MSGYQYGQGQWPPQQPPPQFSQYDYSPSNNQSQYPYQQPPSQDPQQAYYGAAQSAQASQAAYDHNAQSSALDMGVDSAGSRSPNAVGGEMSWSQAFGGGAPASAPSSSYNPSAPSYQPHQHQHRLQDQSQHQQPQQYQQQLYQGSNSRTPTGYQQQSYGQQQQYSQQQYAPQAYEQPPPPPPPQHQPYTAPSYPSVEQGRGSEEGELSDDMDDLYDPEEPADPAPRSPSSQDAPVQPTEVYLQPASPEMPGTALGQAAVDMPSRDASVIDTQDDAFYDDDDDEPGEIKSTGNGVSASDAADADVEDMDYSDSATNKSLVAAADAAQDRAMSYSPRLSPGEIDDEATRATEVNGTANGYDHQKAAASSTASYATVDEAKKKAQQAILRLIRYDVNYQTFVDEGVDGQVLKSLFTELGLKIDPVKEAEGATSPVQAPAEATSSQEQETQDRPSTADASTAQKEERKDRIARLLALKKAAKPAPAPAPVPSAPAAPATNAKSEKSRLLQQKLEALKQMHEKRAAAAAAKVAEVAEAATPAAPTVLPASIHHSLPPRPVTSNSFALPPAPAAVDAANSRKRPVAADFGDFSQTQAPAYKRPYGMARQESTLVIDVSDDESQDDRDEGEYDEDDDDVEMEIESVDEAVSPVMNFANKKMQPPTAPASMIARAKDKDDEYARKMRQIEDMKRKIAEIEAKKQRGSSGSVTPVTGGHGTPPEVETANSPNLSQGRNFDAAQIVRPPLQAMRRITSTGEMSGEMSGEVRTGGNVPDDLPIRLPKRGEQATASPLPSLSSHSSRGLREERVRAASLQLPRVEASLQEKMFKLRLLQDKIKTLQAEISNGMAEKERLTQDLETADSDSEAVDANANDGNSHSGSVIVIDSPAVASPAQETVKETVQQVERPVEAEAVEAVAEIDPPADVDMQAPVEDVEDVNTKPAETAAAPEVAADEADEYEPMLSGDEQGSESAPMSVASSVYDPEDVVVENQSGEDGEVEEEEGEEEDQEEEKEDEDDDSDEDMMMEDDGEVFIIDDGEPSNAAPTPVEAEAEAAEAAEVEAEVEAEILEQIHADIADDAVHPPVPAPTTTVATTSKPTSKATTIPPLTTYDSPLKYFKSYRFHPQYKAQVAGGLRSLTYSGKIRDDIPLCPSESAGEVCDNPACPFQHFQSIQPQDDQILVELGRSDEYTGEQQSRFVDGLKAVLKRVRDEQVRDFETIAAAIIEFRREFLADETRVLANLGGTTV